MISREEATSIALSLPEVAVADHHGMDSLRIRGRVIATFPDDGHLRVMLDEAGILASVAEYPDICAPYYWGPRLACVVVTLAAVEADLVGELLTDAWCRKAPKKLLTRLDR